MANIDITISLQDGENLSDALKQLGVTSAVVKTNVPSVRVHEALNDDDEFGAGAIQDAEPGERQRRTRRTKAEIAADEAAKQNTGDAEKTPPASSGGPTATKPSADVFGDQLKEVTSGALTLADVEAVGRQAFEKIGAAATQALLVEHGGGAKAFKAVEPQYFIPLHAALSAAAEG